MNDGLHTFIHVMESLALIAVIANNGVRDRISKILSERLDVANQRIDLLSERQRAAEIWILEENSKRDEE